MNGYELCIENATALQHAALAVVPTARATALALAQIGQEELGKSMMLLCAAGFESKDQWREFWRRWNSHDAKAHMAHWYEWVDPLNFSLTDPEGRSFDGAPVRDRFSDEKEAGLYVDFDEEFSAFVLPAWRVPPIEAYGRMGTLGTLGLTASGIRDVILMRNSEFRTDVMSRHVLRLWNGFVSQEQMMAYFSDLESESALNASFIADLHARFKENREVMGKMFRPDA